MTQKPTIIVFSGPMFAGKSTNLLEAYKSSQVSVKCKLMFKYAKDIRYSKNAEIVTHNQETVPCIMITSCADIATYLNNKSDSTNPITEIYIDECQFLPDILQWITEMQSTEFPLTIKTIILAGLDLDATGKPFTEAFKSVIELADVCFALTAKCYVCDEPAQYTKLLENNDMSRMVNNVLIGGAELYQPACKQHFNSTCYTFCTGLQAQCNATDVTLN